MIWALGIGLLTAGLTAVVQVFGVNPGRLGLLWVFGLPSLLTYRFVKLPNRFCLCLAAILGVGSAGCVGVHGRVLRVERNFFGVLRVTEDVQGKYHRLIHGATLHGRQSLDPAHQAEPLAYYHGRSPLGQVFDLFNTGLGDSPASVAVIGLGAGSSACYAKPAQDWTFYEINPAVETIARGTNCFTLLRLSRAKRLEVILGDARLRLRDAPDHRYNLIVLDAFSSDSIPVHVATREAVRLYRAKLAKRGILACHISNRRLDLKPVMANLAQDAGLAAIRCENPSDDSIGKEASIWVVMAERTEDIQPLPADRRWHPLTPRPDARVWNR